MKTGILTFHNAYNYGAVLQCYALQETLREMGLDVYVIDYRQRKIAENYRMFVWKWFLKKLPFPKRLIKYIGDIRKMRRKKRLFDNFVDKFLRVDKTAANVVPVDYDAYVVGSDQVWGLHCTGAFDMVYSGQFERRDGSLLVGYAISSTARSMAQIGQEELSAVGCRFDALSFREREIEEEMEKCCGRAFPVVLDPTLLAEDAMWHRVAALGEMTEKTKPYILVYEVRYKDGHQSSLLHHAKGLAERIGAEVVVASAGELPVCDFVSLFKDAACVITSSFHAVAFSVIFETPFYSYRLGDGKDNRYVDLLQSIGLGNLLVDLDFSPLEVPAVDFMTSKKLLAEKRNYSRDFLAHTFSCGDAR